MTMQFDAEDLTLDEIEEVLNLSGSTFKDFEQGNITPKTLKAIAYVALRRDNPDVTMEEVGKLKIRDLTSSMGKADG